MAGARDWTSLSRQANDPAAARRPARRGKRAPNPTDIAVGARLREARQFAGATQEELARALGISGQAVQKYEIGENRLSAGRLVAAAGFLGVPMAYFFKVDLDGSAGNEALSSDERQLLRYFRAIPDAAPRSRLIKLAQRLSAASHTRRRGH
jgi:transcriptional regulator with XRE-family HTH domain